MGVARPESGSEEMVTPQSDVVSIGQRLREMVSSLPLSLALNLENGTCHADVGQSSRYIRV